MWTNRCDSSIFFLHFLTLLRKIIVPLQKDLTFEWRKNNVLGIFLYQILIG